MTSLASAAPAAEPALPPPAGHRVDFKTEIQPLLESSCIQCHAKGKTKGGLSVETRESLLKGGDNGPAAVVGKSADSAMVQLVASAEAETVMPKKGSRWTPQQIGLLRAWIDQGMAWPAGVTFAKPPPQNLNPRVVTLPAAADSTHPLDRLLAAYASSKGIKTPDAVDDRLFARRVYLDTIGLLPSAADLDAFVSDNSSDKRARLIRKLLSDDIGYADHWITFWNDLLRNDYKGTGYIDGGRKQITGWLYSSLLLNKPYDQFVRELVAPGPDSEGFTKGIVWRGVVPASMTPPMQAAQSIAQTFFGINLKCASCHDSFVSDWTLADAYGLAAIYSDKPLEMVRCDRALGKTVEARFLYPEIGGFDPKLSKTDRLKRFADLMTSPKNGRLSRNIVNRLWARLLGRGLVDPVDDMDKPAWSADVLDWLAEDLVASKYDLKHTIELIMTSRAYQLPVVDAPPDGDKTPFVFKGPWARRLTAEQMADAVAALTGDWARTPSSIEFDFSGGGKLSTVRAPAWIWTNEPVAAGIRRSAEQAIANQSKAPAKPAAPAAKAGAADADDSVAATDKVAEPQKDTPAKPGAAKRAARAPKGAKPAADKATAGKPASDKPTSDKPATADPAKPEEVAAKAAEAASAKAAVIARAELVLSNPELPALLAAAPEKLDPAFAPLVRHKVVFRKTFTLDALPDQAYAAVAASQKLEIMVNGKAPAIAVSDRERGKEPRSAVVDLKPLLRKGENSIAIAVDSHTERPNLKAEDREKLYAVFNHLNERSGMTFGLHMSIGGKPIEWSADATWRVSRAPAAGWQTEKFDDQSWPVAIVLPKGVAPADDGPAIDDNGRKAAGKIGNEMGPKLQGLMAMSSRIGKFRAALVASDPLQLALDRPNREQIVSCRQNSATTIQALELTNGATLDNKLKKSAKNLAADAGKDPSAWIESVYQRSLCRKPTESERSIAKDLLGPAPKAEAVADLLWAVLMQPEFQLVH
ncbi:DUF1549 domain-containing protein [Humisphaera borealis]|uniref:DUF1553 domain-containing protein n=1 Tax=Humisphaera borealis TaxID=2807512 RepID=A0A7M2WVN2_9BACT|nr:DUF1549 domain-containing protein [Humisphaera borealis]QOV89483.1 DUF1553 domain-containing protein [Humisphaera borealis]